MLNELQRRKQELSYISGTPLQHNIAIALSLHIHH